jgi:hypothetical protein
MQEEMARYQQQMQRSVDSRHQRANNPDFKQPSCRDENGELNLSLIIKRDAAAMQMKKQQAMPDFKKRERLNAFPIPFPAQRRRSSTV